MKAKPIQNERRPAHPIRWGQPPGTFPYKVQDGDDWANVALKFQVKSARYLIFVNFYVDVIHPGNTDEVNWYLREYVGCCETMDHGRNWAFTSKASPGIIYVPRKVIDFEGEGEVITGSKGVGGDITVSQYDDNNFMDTVSKALDIYGIADLGLGVSEVALPVLAEAGLIVGGAASGVLGPLAAVGSGHADALRAKSRNHFFEGFSIGLVMSAHTWSKDYIRTRHSLKYKPQEDVYPEKAETFRKLHNAGLELGMAQGQKFNTVDSKAFFSALRDKLTVDERHRYRGRPKEWSEGMRRDYYDRLSSIVKRSILDNNLQLKVK